jgi:hypothetical protein
MLPPFEAGYRKLSAAFGISYNDGRCQVYYDKIGRELDDEDRWRRMVSKWLNDGTAFPKISDLMGMPEFTYRNRPDHSPDPLEEWVRDDCPVMECNSGYIHVQITASGRKVPLLGPDAMADLIPEQEVSYRCPKCQRIPDGPMPPWRGEVNLRTSAEMVERMVTRRGIVADTRAGCHAPPKILTRFAAEGVLE